MRILLEVKMTAGLVQKISMRIFVTKETGQGVTGEDRQENFAILY